MASLSNLPSLLVFGPQTEFPSEDVLQSLRQEVTSNPRLSALKNAVDDLPRFWRNLVDFDPELRQIPGDRYFGQLRQWINDGGSFPHYQSTVPSHYGLAVIVLLQIGQYARYLDHLGKDSHLQVLKSVQTGGIQGFCVGFLSAVAVASSKTEADLGSAAAVALRLAVCIGACVDLDGICSQESNEYACVAIRWREDNSYDKAKIDNVIQSLSGAYISSVNDKACVTVTLRAADVDALNEMVRALSLRSKAVAVHGRFHTSDHSHAADKLSKLVSESEDLRLPAVKKLLAPVRSTVDGEIISEGCLIQHVLENTLLKTADWNQTLRGSILQLPESHKKAGFAGFGNHIPQSLVQTSSLEVLALSKLEGSKLNGLPKGSPHLPNYPSHSIAIVGMAGRFPGADSVDELWDLILEGKSMVEPATVERLRLSQTGDFANTKWWGNFIRDPDAFDHRFFKKSSREALAWDPQQRILLEVVYAALESAGYFGASSTTEPDDYGCYIGACISNYYDNVSCHPPTSYATMGTTRGFISGCMSHYFGWTGPSLTIDTACSSSLVAINTACRAIWSGECSRAVAGGTNVISSPFDYQNLSAAGFLSPTGQCKPFDMAADGYCRGEGVGVVVLKRLSAAVNDQDNVLGVIVGSAANQNHNDSLITVPHSGSQSELYRNVLKSSGLGPESVSYVEAHGTGTGVGDPVEVRSIRNVFGGPQRDSLLHFSSIKGNIGHTEGTAGVAGLIKVLLMMKHGKIPMQASHSTLNPKIPPLEQDQMAIPREVLPWCPPFRAAFVNGYGAAGSNSAVMVLEKPSAGTPTASPHLSQWPLFISAGSANSLSMYSRKLRDWLKSGAAGTGDILASLTFNLADRANHALPHTLATTVSSVQDLELKLEAAAASGSGISTAGSPKPVILVFGGQESNFIGLSEDIYQSSKVFRHHLDSCSEVLVSKGLESFFPAIFQQKPIQNLVTLHSALFAVQYASAKAWMDCGLKVSAVVGHSFGQLTALCISGVLSLSNAVTLVTGRASLMMNHWGDEPGSMIFLQADRQTVDQALELLKAPNGALYAEIACYNGPNSHVVVGSSEAIVSLEQQIADALSLRDSVRTKRLKVTHGFHSKFTEPMLPHLTGLAKELSWRGPNIHLETCDEDKSVSEPDFKLVSHHTRRPVFFQQAIERLTERFSQSTWIEVGRGSSVIQLVKGSVPGDGQGHAFLSPQLTSSNAQASLTNATIDLWEAGYAVQYWPFHRDQKPEYGHLSLPPYQFEKTRHWLPFTGNRSKEEAKRVDEVVTEDAHEILSFIRFKDGSQSEAVFRVDPQAERFIAMLDGHVMAGQGLCPASLYYELVSRAALFLQQDTEAVAYVPTVDDLVMKSPIGKITSIEIILKLTRLDDVRPSWSFSITTQATVGPVAQPFEVSTGKVCLKKRNDEQTAREFKRFESLMGHGRVKEVLSNPDAEKMQGNHIYRAFSTVVYYGTAFRGIKQIACVGMEAAGKVVITPDSNDPADQRLCDTPMTDSFMQFAGFLVNYFNNASLEDVLVCGKIEHIEIGGSFNPDAKEWIVYANMTEGGETDMSADAYVFEADSKKMVMAVFGLQFNKMPQAMLGRMLKSVNKSGSLSAKTLEKSVAHAVEEPAKPTRAAPTTESSSRRRELFHILSDVTDYPLEDLKDSLTLDDLGIDSLMATEVLNNIRSDLAVNIDLTSFLFSSNIGALAAHVDEKLGLSGEDDPALLVSTPASWDLVSTFSSTPVTPTKDEEGMLKNAFVVFSEPAMTADRPESPRHVSRPAITSAVSAFQETRLQYDHLAEGTKALDFWSQAYPHQARLVLAYVVEAFAGLGCHLSKLSSGDDIPKVRTLDKHKRLVRQLFRVLEHGKLIFLSTDQSFARTDVPVDTADAESIYQQIIDLYPQHASVNQLVRIVGSQMAACLAGKTYVTKIVFGDPEAKKTLEDIYEFWPLFRTPTLVLGDFLVKAFTNATGGGKFRILEVGAGTGGTTRYIIKHLRSHGIPFEYIFTDISSSLVAAARQQFKGVEGMSFEVLNIEQPPKSEHNAAFHCIIASNTIHATRNLDLSLRHLRTMIREDGALTLVEITRQVFWLDVVFGQFEGWWLFEDGRSHALVDEEQWESRMRGAGFDEVLWSDGASPEAKTVRVIAGFPSKKAVKKTVKVKATLETVVYKRIGDLQIHADVYYPADGELTGRKMPVALMIHGGSHIMFTRKDVRPAQTRVLLEKGFLPVALDHRLCPEVTLSEGPMVDVCDALEWARNMLPNIKFKRPGLQIDGERVVVVGWSSGGQLAMSTAWTAPQRGLRPPEAILAFYCPTNYEDEWWRHPIQPIGAEDRGMKYDVLEAVQDEPITNYGVVGAWEPLSDPRILTDARCRIVLHINWKAQTLPVITGGLPSKKKAAQTSDIKDWDSLPQPSLDKIRVISPLAHIRQGTYNTPTFLIHGTADDLIPWQQSQGTYEAMVEKGIPVELALVEGAPHITDLSSNPDSEGWKAALRGYEFISSYVF